MKTDKIVIVGGGSAGWMTAATLIQAFPQKTIIVIESKNVPTVGVGESTIGGIRKWTRFIGLDETHFFKATDASLKLSIKFTDFYKKGEDRFRTDGSSFKTKAPLYEIKNKELNSISIEDDVRKIGL